ncbi:hypothetical protein [Pseudomonas graminis]|uniref:Uncharacterized protein n=1 Tax=Pseudomonas graminis TaxID=158627 RepID=A0A1I0D5Q0_9PSED|nr:hypothetical protein [Pseudomonas graminis]SET27162.1 hypothetical protein SAMN05216197_109129 [Pseudomonas graminis]
MTDNLDNVLLVALADDALDKFIVGEPFYFVEAKTDTKEPQNVRDAFDLLVLDYWTKTKNETFAVKFATAMLKALDTYPDKNRAIYAVSYWIQYYQYCLIQKKSNPNGKYGALFEMDTAGIARAFKHELEVNKAELINDTRWAGESWNSKQGLWEPLMRMALGVRDKFEGPDFVPDNL